MRPGNRRTRNSSKIGTTIRRRDLLIRVTLRKQDEHLLGSDHNANPAPGRLFLEIPLINYSRLRDRVCLRIASIGIRGRWCRTGCVGTHNWVTIARDGIGGAWTC
jgi:hypothetical protein